MVPPSSQGVPSYEEHETSYRLPGIHGAIPQWMSLGASPWSRVAHYMLLLGLTQRLGDIKPLLGSSLLPLRSRGRGQRRFSVLEPGSHVHPAEHRGSGDEMLPSHVYLSRPVIERSETPMTVREARAH